jgi:hypothetical protein
LNLLRLDLAALEREHLIESFPDTEHAVRYRIVSTISKTALAGSCWS